MSKEMSTDWRLPGVPQPPPTHTDTQTDGWLLTRVASRLDPDPHKLRRFAQLLGIDDDTYRTIQQQTETAGQELPIQVSGLLFLLLNFFFTSDCYFLKYKNGKFIYILQILSYWTRENPNFSQLFAVFLKAEELSLVEKNTIVSILQDEKQQASHGNCKYL